MPIFQDLTGMTFGRLTVLERVASTSQGGSRWRCRCDCGGHNVVCVGHLRSGAIRSCGCLHREAIKLNYFKSSHGDARRSGDAPEYVSWRGMITRCENPNATRYDLWGGRGIRVCDRWRNGEDGKSGYECFLEDMGRKPSPKHSIDRFPDNDGNYEPDNCRWATRHQQRQNRRDSAQGASP